MTEYIYRGFKISYKVFELGNEINNFKADGTVVYLLNRPASFKPVKFHTELDTHDGAEHEIKKLLENYVDFELKSFYEMEKEKAGQQ